MQGNMFWMITGIVLSGIALILNTVGLAIPYWFYLSRTEGSVTLTAYIGLWQGCVEKDESGLSEKGCGTFDKTLGRAGIPLPIEFHVTRGLEIVAVLLIAAALVLAFLKTFVQKENKILTAAAGGIAIVAGLLMIIGALVFEVSDNVKAFISDVPLTPHAGFALCIVAGIVIFMAAVTFFLDMRKNSGTDGRQRLV